MRLLVHAVTAIAALLGPVAVTSLMTQTPVANAGVVRGVVGPWRSSAMNRPRFDVADQSVQLAASNHGPIALGTGPTRVVLSPPSGVEAVPQRIRTLPASDQIYLILQGVGTNVPPGVTYNVYLGLPDTVIASGPADPHYIGTFSFFDAGPWRDAAFNVTDKIKAFDETGKLGSQPTVTVIPAGSPEGASRPTINQFLLVAAGS